MTKKITHLDITDNTDKLEDRIKYLEYKINQQDNQIKLLEKLVKNKER